ncbi:MULTISPECIES: helix-turn-helix domain-containing protein [unclassified Sedimentibacter]|uniref:helix-turn-helix domain-containing protein n=1 Tax=unclassified Sedimentibacter TaxID=2649220 RepID=UPI0027DF6118|nr:helix-turn-helix domain-containing protein [Sedimentibacter sp. MB35-C1]WMJ78453.1 helix-turn-helix domain-containing protein [Sedimentibacter sp. MB35-C1]
MTDTYKLKCLILKSDMKLKDIAKKMGISYFSLQKKMNNVVEFKASEIMELSKILNIKGGKEKEEIFFVK